MLCPRQEPWYWPGSPELLRPQRKGNLGPSGMGPEVPSLQWRQNEPNGVSNHRRLNCLLKLLFRRKSKKTSKLRVTGLCEVNSPVACGFPVKRASNTENVYTWWCHHDDKLVCIIYRRCASFRSLISTPRKPVSDILIDWKWIDINHK